MWKSFKSWLQNQSKKLERKYNTYPLWKRFLFWFLIVLVLWWFFPIVEKWEEETKMY